jgi:hypothetical protein
MIHTGLPRHSTTTFSPGLELGDIDLDRSTGGLGALGGLETADEGDGDGGCTHAAHGGRR